MCEVQELGHPSQFLPACWWCCSVTSLYRAHSPCVFCKSAIDQELHRGNVLWGGIGGSKGGANSDGHEKAEVGMVRARRDDTAIIREVSEWKWRGIALKEDRSWKDNYCQKRPGKEEWATDREIWKGLCKTRYHAQGDGGEMWES